MTETKNRKEVDTDGKREGRKRNKRMRKKKREDAEE